MKLPCYLVRDLLPLFKDNVCDPNTAADVQEHLDNCAECRTVLQEMDAPEMEIAAVEEKNAASIVALTTVKKDIGKLKKKIALTVTAVLVVLFGVFFGWRYWMMHSYVDLPHTALETKDIGYHQIAFRDKNTKIYYGSVGYVIKYYKGVPIAFMSVTQTRWELMTRKSLKNNKPVSITLPGTHIVAVGRDTYLKLSQQSGYEIDEMPWDDTITPVRVYGTKYGSPMDIIVDGIIEAREAAGKNCSTEK